ncbi:MAG: crotonase/enoyl-CoA hydratase family protein [Pseudomonadota bacterium]
MADQSFNVINLDIEDGIATITLNRPHKMNAFTSQMAHEMISAFDITDADDSVGAVIVTGSGDRAFCAGADLSGGEDTFNYDAQGEKERSQAPRDEGGLVTLRIFNSLKPVIAAINGVAVGVGATMTLAMDIRMASKSSRFGFVFNRRGIAPESASAWFLPKLVGVQTALEWVFTGRVFQAEEAHGAGLVRSLHPADQLMDEARSLAREIVDNTAPVSTALSRHMIWRQLGTEHPMDAHILDSKLVYARGKSADAVEGVSSFLEKRDPDYPCKVSTDMPDVFPWWEEPEYN